MIAGHGTLLALNKNCVIGVAFFPPALIKMNGLLFVMKLVLLFIVAGAYFVLFGICYVLESGVSDVVLTSYTCSIVVHKITQFFGNWCLLWLLLTV
jgi:hypothetical protein